MTTKQLLEETVATIEGMAGNEYLYFDNPAIATLLTQKTWWAWGVCVSPSKVLYVMDATEEWHEVAETDLPVIEALHRMVKQLRLKEKD